jgi:hypothetical protein
VMTSQLDKSANFMAALRRLCAPPQHLDIYKWIIGYF